MLMPVSRRPVPIVAAAFLVVGLALLASLPAAALPGIAPLKATQIRRLAREPMKEKAERAERYRELRRLAREMAKRGTSTLRSRGRGERARYSEGDEDVRAGRLPAAPRAAAPFSAQVVPTNVRCNNPAGDAATDGQCETSIARWQGYMVAAWNDGHGYTDGSNQTQGWATSIDGGQTWIDQGRVPLPGAYAGWVWTSDPVVVVNPTTGAFYFSALGDASLTLSAIGVTKGRFDPVTHVFTWSTVSVARTVANSSDFLDKEWIAVDPSNGRVHLTYTRFPSNVSQINAQYADSALTSWSIPVTISAAGEGGRVQGSRPVVTGPGTVVAVYYLIGTVDVDYLRVVKSTTGGITYSAPVDAVAFFTNYGTGAPGFNRELGIEFPSIAVDRSQGTHNGRIYLSWAESLNWYDDEANIGLGGTTPEAESNDTPASATPVTVGKVITGSLSSTNDLDYYAVPLTAGQTIIVEATAVASGETVTLRMFATDGTTRLAFTVAASTDIVPGYAPPSWIYTAPTTGTYYIRIASAVSTGAYTLKTGPAAAGSERGTDQRDVFVAYSDNGTAWSTPSRVDASAPGFDDWLPEVAVAANGDVYCAWYDWRNAPVATCGGESEIYLARSSDGGTTWSELGAMTDARTAWTNVSTNIAPNEGDYMSLFTEYEGLTAAWSDGRAGNPDVYMSFWQLAAPNAVITVVSATATPSQASLRWASNQPFVTATVYRREGAAAFTSVGSTAADGSGTYNYTDGTVVAGTSYDYRLGVMINSVEQFGGIATVTVPLGLDLAIGGPRPNPAGAGAQVHFTLASSEPATLELIDVVGRVVNTMDVGSLGAGTHTVPLGNGGTFRSGNYMLRLKQGGHAVTSRVTIVR
jgi:hypothetical protein